MTDETKDLLGTDMVALSDIAKPVFNLSPRIAQRKAATQTLPVPAFRIGDTKKGPLYVLRQDLDKLVQDRIEAAKIVHRKMQAV